MMIVAILGIVNDQMFTTLDMYNNSSSIILDNEFPDDFLMQLLFSTIYSLRRYNVGTIEKCLIHRFNLIHLL